MDHSHMDHGNMGHGDMGHGDMGHDAPMCNMNMLFTWDTTNLCIVFQGWRITNAWSLIYSLVLVALLTAGYEAVREASRRYDEGLALRLQNMPLALPTTNSTTTTTSPDHENENENEEETHDITDERSSLLWISSGNSVAAEEKKGKVVKALFYGLQVFYSFFIMLLFMTYNGWIMISVGVGAVIGYLLFGSGSSSKTAACH